MPWDELKRLQAERRRLRELEEQLDSPAARPGSRIYSVMQEHKRRLEARYRQAVRRAGEPEA